MYCYIGLNTETKQIRHVHFTVGHINTNFCDSAFRRFGEETFGWTDTT